MRAFRWISLSLVLVACQNKTVGAPPSVTITAPGSGQVVAGVVTVGLQASSAAGIQRVDLYVRPVGSTSLGVVVGGASAEPYQVGWSTFEQPTGTALELVAQATDKSGNKGQSQPVGVQVSNAGTPTLKYLAAISYPTPVVGAASLREGRPQVNPSEVSYPERPQSPSVSVQSALRPLSGSRTNDLEWGWSSLSGADGYGIYLATSSLAGPYLRQRNQAASGLGDQGYAVTVSGESGDHYYGAVSTITGSAESGLSNAADALILPEPLPASPANGQTVTGGRPTLTWTPTTGASGYLYYVYDKNPSNAQPKAVWTNYPTPDGATAAVYPSSLTALNTGTYYWRVAAVGFDSLKRANSFSFSTIHTFVVP